jgi:MFS family permease
MDHKALSLRSYWILFFLLLLNILNMLDRTLLIAFGPQIVDDLELSDTQYGLLTGFVFNTFYCFFGLLMGTLADRVNRVRLIAFGLIIWSALTAVSGSAKNFYQIGLARLFVGIGESVMTPSAISIMADLFPNEKRGAAAGIYYLGIPFGAGGAFFIAGILGPTWGWRNCFYLLGAIGISATLFLLALRDPPRGVWDRDSLENSGDGSKHSFIKVLINIVVILKGSRALIWILLGSIAIHIPIGAGAFNMIWMQSERGFDESVAILYGVYSTIFMTIGMLSGGLLSDVYTRHFRGGRARFLALFMLALTPFTVGFRFWDPESIFFYIGLSAILIFGGAFFGPAFSLVQDLCPPRSRGVMTAVALVAMNFLGVGSGALILGMSSDIMREMGVSEPYTYALLACDLIGALTIPCFYIASVYTESR